MAELLNVEIVAVEAKVWSGQAEMLIARTTEGELGILHGHAPLLGELAEPGEVRIKKPGGEEIAYTVNGGFLSVTTEGVTVLAETASPATPAASSH
ncbi:F0F1 ATP synthase subunit epsilon [Phytomonospora sp. NPDC050363]|uniref:F0F1 ATP synthase subunit epsilon n=1 Tax=Phytomonospora sp. NPDC050363 TaxID=3155642 RepID=UPI0033BFDFA7